MRRPAPLSQPLSAHSLTFLLSLVALALLGYLLAPPTRSARAQRGRAEVETTTAQEPSVRVSLTQPDATVSLRESSPLSGGETSGAQAAPGATRAEGRPTALAAGDFDGDGAQDLAAAYADPSGAGGTVTIYRGSAEALFPNGEASRKRRAQGAAQESPFVSSETFETAEAPELIGAGDFDADGKTDLVLTARGQSALTLLKGDGGGKLSAGERVELPGQLTALAVGEFNLSDGLADIAVGVVGKRGAQALVFQSASGAFKAKAKEHNLPAPAQALAVGQLDADAAMDLAVAAGNELHVFGGRDAKQSAAAKDKSAKAKPAGGAPVYRHAFASPVRSLAVGDFRGDPRADVMVLTDDGALHVAGPASASSVKSKRAASADAFAGWLVESTGATVSGAAHQLVAARVSAGRAADLLVVDRDGSQVQIVAGERAASEINAAATGEETKDSAAAQQAEENAPLEGAGVARRVEASVAVEGGAPVAVLPMRLNGDAVNDLVILKDGAKAPFVVMSVPAHIFAVDSNGDASDSNLADNLCLTAGSVCTLRAAIQQANASAGADLITFDFPGPGTPQITPNTALPTITEAVTIDGTTSQTGTVDLNGNTTVGADGFRISGGSSRVLGMNIFRFDDDGIDLRSIGNVVDGNNLGFGSSDFSGSGNGDGVTVFQSSGNTIGGTIAAARNLISGNNEHGVFITGLFATDNVVLGNYIGTNGSGTTAFSNVKHGVSINGGANNTVGGTASGARNLISGNGESGVFVFGGNAAGNEVQGNYIGTDVTGTAPVGNGDGVTINDAPDNLVGGTTAAARNLISGNSSAGVSISIGGATGNLVQGNYIGTHKDGATALGNFIGVFLSTSSDSTIGGTDAGARNVISNNSTGVNIVNSEANQILGNYIGVGADGSTGAGNTFGVAVGGENNTVGGSAPGSRNVISGNFDDGVILLDPNNFVLGNYIGTDAAGTAALANAGDGIEISNVSNNTVGGTAEGARNVISGNDGHGVNITGGGSQSNVVLGNYIGTNAAGTGALGNFLNGVLLDQSAAANTVGGTAAGSRNVISGNGGVGVQITGESDANTIEGNFIGTNAAGSVAIPNPYGILINGDSHFNLVGGTAAGAGNVISGNSGSGVYIFNNISTTATNAVQGNLIGTNATGAAALGNGEYGVLIEESFDNLIGGAEAAARNVISGNAVGVYIIGSGAQFNAVWGNYIGTNATGTAAVGNEQGGVLIQSTSQNEVGCEIPDSGNLISGNGGYGVALNSAADNEVAGNRIGTDATGMSALGNTSDGVLVGGSGSASNAIGSTTVDGRNVISGNGGHGIHLNNNSPGTTIDNNYIGTNAAGNADLGNLGDGIHVEDSTNNQIGNQSGNVISGNEGDGVELGAGGNNNVFRNKIGTDAAGTADLGNTSHGIFINGSPDNTVGGGGATPFGNVVSGNGAHGVLISGGAATNNEVYTNVIGLSNAGADLGNSGNGVMISNAPNNRIGNFDQVILTVTVARGNVISGNDANGVEIVGSGATGNTVANNRIGTNSGGGADRGNSLDGVRIVRGANNTVGGVGTGLRNIISGNDENGVNIRADAMGLPATGNTVSFNYIGVGSMGNSKIPNGLNGVLISNSTSNTIGGTTANHRNVISGNEWSGVRIFGEDASLNQVVGNYIGVGADGSTNLGNNISGVTIVHAPNNTVGGSTNAHGNRIWRNGEDGVLVVRGTAVRNRISRNSIFNNRSEGIDLGNDGVTPGDHGDPDPGPNLLQNFPSITAVSSNGGSTTITGTLNSTPSTTFTLQFFVNDTCDPSNHGEGQTFLHENTVTTNAAGVGTFTYTFSATVAAGKLVTATATDPNGNTSEFSQCRVVTSSVII